MRNTIGFVALVAAVFVISNSLTAQNETDPNEAETTPNKEAAERRGPLPFYFGKLGLSDLQKESMYDLQEDYDKKLEPLREQLKTLVRERDAKMESMLTAGQKLRLQELREEAKAKEATEAQKRVGEATEPQPESTDN